jgi:predicted RND superfamily exporter protein
MSMVYLAQGQGAANSAPPPSRLHRLFARYVALVDRRTRWFLIGLFIITAGAIFELRTLQLHTDISELLPDNHPSVTALRTISPRQKSATNLVMLVHSPEVALNRRFVDALRPKLEKLIPSIFTEIQWKPETEIPEYAQKQKYLYAEVADLQKAESLLDRVIARRTSPLVVDLEGDPEAELRDLRKELNAKLPPRAQQLATDAAAPGGPPPPARYFEGEHEKRQYLGIMLWRRSDGIASAGDLETMRIVQKVVAELNPASFSPELKVEYCGVIAQGIDEQNGIRDDLVSATALCATLVFLSIFFYFRRISMMFILGAPAVLGLLASLVLAKYTIHFLNLNTSFLISIILGNGINSPIILCARYGEERRRGAPVTTALTTAMVETFAGTLTAVCAASIAYGCLVLTSFRGFNQFGLIGGAGMLFVWGLTFLVVPPVVIIGERLFPGRFTPGRPLWHAPFAWLGRFVARYTYVPAIASLVLLAVAAAPLARYAKDPIEWNFDNLRSDDTQSARLWPIMEQLGMGDVGAGYVGNDGVMLADKPEQADIIAEALRKKDRATYGDRHCLREVRTLNSLLPKQQDEKLEILGRIRAKLDKRRNLISDDEWKELGAWRPADTLRRLTVDDLPRQVREAFTEIDGQRGRLIGIDADNQNFYGWNGHDLIRISKVLNVEVLGKTWTAASVATIFAGMLEAILRDGPRVTLAALIGVMVMVTAIFGVRGAIPVLTALAVGIMWLGGLAGRYDIKLNFMNFVALPITLGIGAEYAANIWARLRRDGIESLARTIADTGSAVALCSLTTIIGYSSLLLSRNRALRSFGKLAVLGEITCLAAALFVLPALARLAARIGLLPKARDEKLDK